MTMRNPLNGQVEVVSVEIDHDAQYRFTWPGQPPRVVAGSELAAICAGADASKLSIERIEAPATKSFKFTGGTDV